MALNVTLWKLIHICEFIAEKILEINLNKGLVLYIYNKYQQKCSKYTKSFYTGCFSLTLFKNIIFIDHTRGTKTAFQTIHLGKFIVLFSFIFY